MTSPTVRTTFLMECPQCKSDEHLRIYMHTWAPLTPDGTDSNDSEHIWDEAHECRCENCDYTARVASFQIPNDPRPNLKIWDVGFYVTDLQVARIEAVDEAHALAIAKSKLAAGGTYEGPFETIDSECTELEVRGISS